MATAHSAASLGSKRPVKTALHQAVLDNRIHQVRLLVDRHGENVDSKDVFGRSPLMLACLLDNQAHSYKMARIFLRAGAYVNAKDNLNRTALHYACLKGKESLVRLLLREDGMEVNMADNDGNTPLMHACLSGCPAIVRLLASIFIKFGIAADDRNGLGYTALLLACKFGHYASALILLQSCRAQPMLRDNEFHLNARDWVVKSTDFPQVQLAPRRRPSTEGFCREHTVYNPASAPPVCRHVTQSSHPLAQSLTSTLRLPAIFSHFTRDKPQEKIIHGEDGQFVLLKAIDHVVQNGHVPQKTTEHAQHARELAVRKKPSTAKLLTFSRSKVMIPTIATIFRLYSEQKGSRPKDPSSARHYLQFGTELVPRFPQAPAVTLHQATPRVTDVA